MASRAINLISLILSFLLIVCIAESLQLSGANGVPACTTLGSVTSGATCDGIINQFKLIPELFSALNPHLNCDNLFVGQWLCIAAKQN
ncbi:hypothetical protein HS088_TW12G00135 [Tripterygium wilfordii]|uniref:LysM domain-containing protein n=1 Tax=Tripterygium wilfordii TaxID=458696 RepID=A0A7J7CYA4_TRIWF|nr:hypothetical protein HS088_TW12G00135 [Tripterygium wilfordii]